MTSTGIISLIAVAVAALAVALLALRIAIQTRREVRRHKTAQLRDGWTMTETVVDVKESQHGTVLTAETKTAPMRHFPFQPGAKAMFREVARQVQK